MKDEGLVPTGAFKARGAAVGVSRAAELGVQGIAMPTNGNAGAAWAAYAARAGLDALIAMPVDAPEITRRECVVTGAELYLVDGLIGDAGALIKQAVASRTGYQDTSTLREPYRIEGKKTMGFEIAEQLGWRCPDVILYPTGGGVGIIAIHKALLELRELGWITGDLPRLVAVQAAGCAPIVDAFEAGLDESTAPADPHTVAFGITVPKALGDFLVLDAVRVDRRARRSRSPTRRCSPRSGSSPATRAPGSARRGRPASPPSGSCASRAGWTAPRTSSCSTPAPACSTRTPCRSTSRRWRATG